MLVFARLDGRGSGAHSGASPAFEAKVPDNEEEPQWQSCEPGEDTASIEVTPHTAA